MFDGGCIERLVTVIMEQEDPHIYQVCRFLPDGSVDLIQACGCMPETAKLLNYSGEFEDVGKKVLIQHNKEYCN